MQLQSSRAVLRPLVRGTQVCHVRKKDIRKFLDGAYVEEKGHITQPAEE